MPTVFTDDTKLTFDKVVIRPNGWVFGIERIDAGEAHHHYPPHRVREIEGGVHYESEAIKV